jgi:hypothetical protein
MFVSLEPIIDTFIEEQFTHAFSDVIRETFTLFDDYGIVAYDHPFLGLLPIQDIKDPGEIRSSFLALLNNQLDYILLVHGIQLIDQVEIIYKNLILRGMLNFIEALPECRDVVTSFLYDPELTNEQKLCEVIAEFILIDKTRLMEIVQSTSSDLVDKMIHLLSNEDDILRSPDFSIENFKVFKVFLAKEYPNYNFTIADSLILSSFPLGLDIQDYLPFCNHYLEKLETDPLTLNIFSLYVISNQYPLGHYIEVIDFFNNYYSNQNKIIDINERFTSLVNEFNTFLKGNYNA